MDVGYTTEWENLTAGMIILCPVYGRTETVVSITTVHKYHNELMITTDHDHHRRLGSELVDYRPAHYTIHELR